MRDEGATPPAGTTHGIILNLGVVFEPEVWMNYRHAQDWFEDALREAHETGHNARRREIVSAVCFADSYLVEWVIFDIGFDFETSRTYLPEDDRRGVATRWRDIPKTLHGDGEIAGAPDLRGSDWQEWLRLVNFRDGLIHSNASRPETANLAEEWMPMPSKSQLEALEPGWAVGVVVDRVRRLHGAVGTDPPAWLADP